MNNSNSRRIDLFVYLPVLCALIAMWGALIVFTMVERKTIINHAQNRLGLIVETLADFNELAESTPEEGALRGSASRSAAIWRALLQYPTASLWVDKDGVATAGQPPAGDLTRFLVVDEVRPGFAVHAALPRVDALAAWQQRALLSAAGMTVVSIGFLVLTWLLVRALRQRADAEREAGGATGAAPQLGCEKHHSKETAPAAPA